jgi:hypothetical protein
MTKETCLSVTYLVELEVVQQIVQLSVLAVLFELDVVLLKTVQGELGLVVDKDLKRLYPVKSQISLDRQ